MSDNNTVKFEFQKEQFIGLLVGIVLITSIALGFFLLTAVDDDEEGDVPDGIEDGDFNYPQGVDETGVTDLEQLLSSHDQILQSTDYEIESTSLIESLNGNESNEDLPQSGEFTYQYDAVDRIAYAVDESTTQTGVTTTETFEDFNISERVTRFGSGEDVEYERTFLQSNQHFTSSNEIGQALFISELEQSEIIGVDDDDEDTTIVYNFVGVDTEAVQDPTLADELDISGEVHINQRGFISYLDADIVNNEFEERSEQTVEITRHDNITIEEPDWVETAREETDDPGSPQPPQEGESPSFDATVDVDVEENDDGNNQLIATIIQNQNVDTILLEYENEGTGLERVEVGNSEVGDTEVLTDTGDTDWDSDEPVQVIGVIGEEEEVLFTANE